MGIFGLFDFYFLMIILLNAIVAIFIDSKEYKNKSDLLGSRNIKISGYISVVAGIALYIAGQVFGGI